MLPAYAGMILDATVKVTAVQRAPRVCGDDPYVRVRDPKLSKCSPRMRG